MKNKTPRGDALHTMLRTAGYKATGPRLAVLGLFRAARNPLSAQEILATLPRSTGIDQATVYRTIKSLKAKGLIKQIDLRHNHAHYELANIAEHHHLICLRCGRMEDVDQCGVEPLQAAVLKNAKHFAEIREHALEFYGVCKACAAKKESAPITINQHAPR